MYLSYCSQTTLRPKNEKMDKNEQSNRDKTKAHYTTQSKPKRIQKNSQNDREDKSTHTEVHKCTACILVLLHTGFGISIAS